jgi:hypothetical protein
VGMEKRIFLAPAEEETVILPTQDESRCNISGSGFCVQKSFLRT